MDSDLSIDVQWVFDLAKAHPEASKQLEQLAEHLHARQQLLSALVQFCAKHSELPLMRMHAEYGAALDSCGIERTSTELPESKTDSKPLGPRQRAAQTKVTRTRTRLVEAAAKLITKGDPTTSRLDDIAAMAGVNIATLYNHFKTRDELIVAAYQHLVGTDQ